MKRDLEIILKNADRLHIVDGSTAIEKFNAFLRGRYKWAVSGVDWRYGPYIERVNANCDFGPIFLGMMERYPALFGGVINVFFYDAQSDIVISGDPGALMENIKIIEDWDSYLITEFWVFDEGTGALIEAYHEGEVTLSIPHDLSRARIADPDVVE
jgi:hypothetical protein